MERRCPCPYRLCRRRRLRTEPQPWSVIHIPRPRNAEPYVRPLSSYLDVRDEIFDKVVNLFEKKELWKQEDLLEQLKYSPEVVTYLVESAIREHLKIKDFKWSSWNAGKQG